MGTAGSGMEGGAETHSADAQIMFLLFLCCAVAFPLSFLLLFPMSTAVTPAVPKGTAAALQLVKCKVSASLLPGNLITGSASSSDMAAECTRAA